jgi:chloramphenicol O-acetyltransferase
MEYERLYRGFQRLPLSLMTLSWIKLIYEKLGSLPIFRGGLKHHKGKLTMALQLGVHHYINEFSITKMVKYFSELLIKAKRS